MRFWAYFSNALAAWLKRPSVTISAPISATGYKKKMSRWHYFTDDEVGGLDEEFVAQLERARKESGVPYIITSAKRLPGNNATVGGVQDSAHLQGKAVDLRSGDSTTHFAITRGAILAGFKRIGLYHDSTGKPSHVHLDNASNLPQGVIWIGESH
jgi:hypothetical protein